jgi:PAP2 superfamily
MQNRYLSTVTSETAARVRSDAAIFLCVALYTIAGSMFLVLNQAQQNAHFTEYLKKAMMLGLFLFPLCALVFDAVSILHRFEKRRGLAFRRAFSARRLASLVAGSALLAAIMLYEGVFTSVKNTLFDWRGGFHFDRIFADLDASLHFGIDPWRIITPIIDSAAAQMLVGYGYGAMWFLITFCTVYFVASSPKADAVRSRYFVSFMLVWFLLGNVLAGIFISAGPAFYGSVTGDTERFSDLLAFLAKGEAMGDGTSHYQAYLWSLHESGQSGFASGISAFPSVHVALAVMNACFAWDANRRLGLFMVFYALFIMAGSVALGWHYAVDGYASAIIVIVMHAVLKRVYARRAEVAFEGQALPVNVR